MFAFDCAITRVAFDRGLHFSPLRPLVDTFQLSDQIEEITLDLQLQ